MARTWTLVIDLSLGASRVLNTDGNIAVGNDVLYFYDRLVGGHGTKVWSWDGSTLTDISGSSFPGNVNAAGKGICWFKNELYLFWFDPTQVANSRQRVFKWAGSGQVWTEVYAFANGHTDGSALKMACDSSRIAIFTLEPSHYRLIASTDGASWATQTLTGYGSDVGEFTQLFGVEHYLGYPAILGYSDTLCQTVAWESGVNWAPLGGACGFSFLLGGYGGGYHFAGDGNSSPGYRLSRSTDWGETPTNPSDAINDGFFTQCIATIVDSDVMMYRYGNDNQAWTYNGTTFVTDGTVASGDIKAFFDLNNTLYCICDGNEVYSAGPITAADRRLYIYRTADKGSTWTSKRVET